MKTAFRLSAAISLGLISLWQRASSFPLDSVYARGDSCISIEWTPDSLNTRQEWFSTHSVYCTDEDTIYLQSDFLAGRSYRSIAYSYGGEDPQWLFKKKINDGFIAGSHFCHYKKIGDPSPYVAGTDCSGFVCHIWNFPRTSTSGLLSSNKLEKISKMDIEGGDILVKAGHAVFVAEREDEFNLIIWESTSAINGCRERSVDMRNSEWIPYTALRNPSVYSGSHALTYLRPQKGYTHNISFRNDNIRIQTFEHIHRIELRSLQGKVVATFQKTAQGFWTSRTIPAYGMYILVYQDTHGTYSRRVHCRSMYKEVTEKH